MTVEPSRNRLKMVLLNNLRNAFMTFRAADLLDIVVIAVILYFVLIWIRQRASRSAIVALALVVVLYTCANVFSMYLTSMLFQAGLTAALVALVLVFQNDLRMAMEHLSSWRVYRSKHTLVASARTIDGLVESAEKLARDKIGALIVIKGRESLDRNLSGGISLGGRLSVPLLYSIFHPSTPSHDGAVILEADRIEYFGVRLPLSRNNAEVGSVGTRHTAGLGLSERSDAFVIIVSEERGVISIAANGHLQVVSAEQLRSRLEAFYRTIFPEKQDGKMFARVSKNFSMKVASFGLAALCWMFFAFKTETVTRTYTVPVEYRNIPQYCTVDNPRPMQVQVSVSGNQRDFTFDASLLAVSLDLGKAGDGMKTLSISRSDVNLPAGMRVQNIFPRSVTVSSQRFTPMDIAVKVRYGGSLKDGLQVVETKIHPSSVRLLVPDRTKLLVTEIPTESLDRTALGAGSTTLRLKLRPPAGTRLLDEGNDEVRVVVNCEKQ